MPLQLIGVPGKVPVLKPVKKAVPVGAKEKAAILKDRLGLSRLRAEAERLIRDHMALWDVSYEEALIAVLHRHPELLDRHKGSGDMKKVSLNTIGRYVDKLAMEKLTQGEAEGYWQAFHQVLADPANKELADLYTGRSLYWRDGR